MAGLAMQFNNKNNKKAVDAASYFQNLFASAVSGGILSEHDVIFMQEQVWSFMGRQTMKYNSGRSSSVTVDTSKELFNSICYSAGIYLKQFHSEQTAMEQLKTKSLETLFLMGQAVIKKKISQGKTLLKKLQENRIDFSNLVYCETITKLPSFFKNYNMQFFAHETFCDIDYPLCFTVPDLCGIEYILEYMRRLHLENAFCNNFSPDLIEKLMQRYMVGYDKLTVVNIFEPVFFNAVGLSVLNKNIRNLLLTPYDKEKLQRIFKNLSTKALHDCIAQSLSFICTEFKIDNIELLAYLGKAQKLLLNRLEQQLKTGNPDALFVAFRDEPQNTGKVSYLGNAQMPDQELRI